MLVDENDVVPDALDAVPGNVKLLAPAEEAEEAGGAVDHNGRRLPLGDLDVYVPYQPQPAAVVDVDDLFPP